MNVTGVSIVPATPADADAVASLVRELGESWGEPSAVDADYVRRYLGFPGRSVRLPDQGVVLLAEVTGERAGMLVYALNPNLFHAADGCFIEELYVRPPWRGKGVGRALVAHVMAEVSVSTGKDNVAALSLYRGLGLVEEYVLLEKHFPGATVPGRAG